MVRGACRDKVKYWNFQMIFTVFDILIDYFAFLKSKM